MAQAPPSGECTSEYQLVRKHYVAIENEIRTVPFAKEMLISEYKKKNWYYTTETPATVSETALIDQALENIKQDPSQLSVFSDMLYRSNVFVKDLCGTFLYLID